MKIRNILYGYEYRDGRIVINDNECAVVQSIFGSYVDGASFLSIAERLNKKQIEYMPDVIGWNKARLMHLINDKRYMGTDIYPNIIDEDIYNKVMEIKCKKNTQKSTDRSMGIYNLNVPVICPICGSEMKRFHDGRRKCAEWWICRNGECKGIANMQDSMLLDLITNILNRIIVNPDIIYISGQNEIKAGTETCRLYNEIENEMQRFENDKNKLRQKIIKYISMQYMDVDDNLYIANRLKADFESSNPLSEFSADLFDKTVKNILIYADGTIRLTLLNNQTVGKDV